MASINDEKLRIMEDEMNRFEEEIGLPNAPLGSEPCQVIGTGTYDQVQRQLDMDAPLAPPHIIPPPPPPPPMFIPQQVRMGPPGPPMPGMGPPMPDQRPGHPGMNFVPGPGPGPMGPFGGPMGPGPMGFRHPGPPHMGPPGMMPPGPMCPPGPPRHPGHMPPPPGFPMGPMSAAPPLMAPPMIRPAEYKSPSVIKSKPVPAKVVVSATPKLYISKKPTTDSNGSAPVIGVSEMPRIEPSSDDAMKKAAKKHTPQKPGGVVAKEMAEKVKASAIVSISTDASAATANASNTQTSKKKDKKSKKFIRTAGGNSWEDSSLCEWEEDDFRLFCGDLGNDVTDEVLNRAFSKYPSFLKAKVVRDKRTNKTKGFGFVSFKDPQDFIRATKEMNGRYVGSRPIKLRKSTWKQRSLEVVRKKDKEKQALIGLLTGR